MKRTTIFLIPEHTQQLTVMAKTTGLKAAHLVRIAIHEYLQREMKRQKAQQ